MDLNDDNTKKILVVVAILIIVYIIWHMTSKNKQGSSENFTAKQNMHSTPKQKMLLTNHAESTNTPSPTSESKVKHTTAEMSPYDYHDGIHHHTKCQMNPHPEAHHNVHPHPEAHHNVHPYAKAHHHKTVHHHPHDSVKDYESLIFDNTTGMIMTGSQFMDNTGVVAPLWVPPAWNQNEDGPASDGILEGSEFREDTRLLYNPVSLSCCSPQYPVPHMADSDPFVFDEDGNRKYYSSGLYGTNNTGGSGCVCLTKNQIDGFNERYTNHKH